jgi:dissimilatory sulfite reductase related protein
MATIEHKGKSYEVDEDGFLLKGAEEWDENWVDYVKSVEGIVDITDEHQKVIDALQEYYKKNGIAPMVRILSKTTGFPLKRIYELFPSGPGKGACKMAETAETNGLRLITKLFVFLKKAAVWAAFFYSSPLQQICSDSVRQWPKPLKRHL